MILAPFEVFSRTILAASFFPDLIGWGAAAAAIDLGLLVLVVKLDADYVEGAASISQKLYERMKCARQGGGVAMATSKAEVAIKSPDPAVAGRSRSLGVAAIADRNATSRLVIVISLGVGCMLLVMALFMPSGPNKPELLIPAMGMGFIVYLTFIFSMQLPWAFRGDIDHMDSLKALPVRPLAWRQASLPGAFWSWRSSSWSCSCRSWPPRAVPPRS